MFAFSTLVSAMNNLKVYVLELVRINIIWNAESLFNRPFECVCVWFHFRAVITTSCVWVEWRGWLSELETSDGLFVHMLIILFVGVNIGKKGVVSKETVVLRLWGSSRQKFGFINGVDNVNWPPYRDSKS